MFKSFLSHHYISKRFDIDESECIKLIKTIYKRKRLKREVPFAFGGSVFVIWMFVFGFGIDALEGTRWDISDLLKYLAIFGVLLMIMLSFGIAALLGIFTTINMRRRLLSQQFQYHLFTPACFWCGYSLKGLESDSNYIKCPECGKRSRTGR